jgi:DNA-binding transcriptional ArsR family regulator
MKQGRDKAMEMALMKGSPDMAERCADIHRILASRRRLMILWTLVDRELSVTEIAHAIGASL